VETEEKRGNKLIITRRLFLIFAMWEKIDNKADILTKDSSTSSVGGGIHVETDP
jgi:hypothetical protein